MQLCNQHRRSKVRHGLDVKNFGDRLFVASTGISFAHSLFASVDESAILLLSQIEDHKTSALPAESILNNIVQFKRSPRSAQHLED